MCLTCEAFYYKFRLPGLSMQRLRMTWSMGSSLIMLAAEWPLEHDGGSLFYNANVSG